MKKITALALAAMLALSMTALAGEDTKSCDAKSKACCKDKDKKECKLDDASCKNTKCDKHCKKSES